ncbi:MAG TPA: AAA family ATPase [Polyangiaceae bacterium]|nr:AAA family ATPase [Polyangiaceae bacterium]
MKAHIEEIRLQNFRAFESARLALADLTFLVGRNGAGKSSILDAIELMREALTDSLPNALDRRDGLAGIKRKNAEADAPVGLAILLRLNLGNRVIRVLYGFRLYMIGGQLEIDEALRFPDVDPLEEGTEEERARKRQGFLRGPAGFQVDAPVSPVQVRHRLLLPLIAEGQTLWRMAWEALSELRGYELSPYVMASLSPIGQRSTLDRNGTNVGDVMSHLLERPEDHAWVNRHLAGVTDGIESVRVKAESGFRRLELTQITAAGTRQILTARQVSQGTLRALGILLALRQSPAPSLVVIDEVEDSIHPLAVDVLLEAIEQSRERFPIVVTTHSPEVLGRKPASGDRIRVLQWRDGVSRIHRLGKGTLDQLDEVTTVGWLLSTNGLGLSQPHDTWSGDLLEWR